MKLHRKILTGVGTIMMVAFAIVQTTGYENDKVNSRESLLDEGRTIKSILVSVRQVYQRAFLENNIPVNGKTASLLPAHTLSEISSQFADYDERGLRFSNVSDQARNSGNTADVLEMEAMRFFRANKDAKERVVRYIDNEGNANYHLSYPLWIESQCLKCHGSKEDAPASIRAGYTNAYDYQLGDLRGILSIRLPSKSLENRIFKQRTQEFIAQFVIFSLCFAAAIWLIKTIVTARIEHLQMAVEEISQGDYQTRLDVKGNDEIGKVAESFNRMSDSIALREQQLKHEKAHYEEILQNIHEIVFQTDLEGHWTFLSPAWETIMGYSIKDSIGKSRKDFVHEDDKASCEMVFKKLTTEQTTDCEQNVRFIASNGDLHFLEIHAKLVLGSDKQPHGVTGTIRDITARIQAEQEADRSNTLNSNILAGISEIFMAVDTNWTVTYANPHVERLGISVNEILGKNIWDTLPELSSFYYKDWRSAMARQSTKITVGLYPPLDLWLEARAYPMEGGLSIYILDITKQKGSADAVRTSEGRLSSILQNSPLLVALKNIDGQYEFCNQRFKQLVNVNKQEIAGKSDEDIFPPTLATELHLRDKQALQQNEPLLIEEQINTSLSEHTFLSTRFPLFDSEGTRQSICWMATDISDRKHAEEKLRLSATVFQNTIEGVIISDPDNHILTVNPSFTNITGYTQDEVRGQKTSILKSGLHDVSFYENMWNTMAKQGYWQGEIWNRRKNGEIFPEWLSINAVTDDSNNIINYVGVFTDISAIKQSEEKLNYLAHHDPLTDLPNRLLFHDRVEHALQRSRRNNERFALLYIDLDHFKTVNDSLGHPIGDELLQQVSAELRNQMRKEDTIARIGGDEFSVLMEEIKSVHDAERIASNIIQSLKRPFFVEEHELYLGASIGISVSPDHGQDLTTLMKGADAAMYKAKEQGRNCFHVSTNELTSTAFERHFLETHLRHALKKNEFVLYYQPQIDLQTGKIIGAEALIRWQHPEMGLVSPSKFIPLAEDTGLIVDIGAWVLQEACRQTVTWQKAGLPWFRIAVNLSSRQLSSHQLVDNVTGVLNSTGLQAKDLELEITESAIMERADVATQTLDSLKELGIYLAIDDFGTGYSSLSYLKRFNVDKLKIDQSFVQDIPQDPNDEAIVLAIIAMGTSLQLKVIAEGVETEEQKDFLTKSGCNDMQGYLYSKPVPAEQFEELLRNAGKPA